MRRRDIGERRRKLNLAEESSGQWTRAAHLLVTLARIIQCACAARCRGSLTASGIDVVIIIDGKNSDVPNDNDDDDQSWELLFDFGDGVGCVIAIYWMRVCFVLMSR